MELNLNKEQELKVFAYKKLEADVHENLAGDVESKTKNLGWKKCFDNCCKLKNYYDSGLEVIQIRDRALLQEKQERPKFDQYEWFNAFFEKGLDEIKKELEEFNQRMESRNQDFEKTGQKDEKQEEILEAQRKAISEKVSDFMGCVQKLSKCDLFILNYEGEGDKNVFNQVKNKLGVKLVCQAYFYEMEKPEKERKSERIEGMQKIVSKEFKKVDEIISWFKLRKDALNFELSFEQIKNLADNYSKLSEEEKITKLNSKITDVFTYFCKSFSEQRNISDVKDPLTTLKEFIKTANKMPAKAKKQENTRAYFNKVANILYKKILDDKLKCSRKRLLEIYENNKKLKLGWEQNYKKIAELHGSESDRAEDFKTAYDQDVKSLDKKFDDGVKREVDEFRRVLKGLGYLSEEQIDKMVDEFSGKVRDRLEYEKFLDDKVEKCAEELVQQHLEYESEVMKEDTSHEKRYQIHLEETKDRFDPSLVKIRDCNLYERVQSYKRNFKHSFGLEQSSSASKFSDLSDEDAVRFSKVMGKELKDEPKRFCDAIVNKANGILKLKQVEDLRAKNANVDLKPNISVQLLTAPVKKQTSKWWLLCFVFVYFIVENKNKRQFQKSREKYEYDLKRSDIKGSFQLSKNNMTNQNNKHAISISAQEIK